MFLIGVSLIIGIVIGLVLGVKTFPKLFNHHNLSPREVNYLKKTISFAMIISSPKYWKALITIGIYRINKKWNKVNDNNN